MQPWREPKEAILERCHKNTEPTEADRAVVTGSVSSEVWCTAGYTHCPAQSSLIAQQGHREVEHTFNLLAGAEQDW